MREQYSVLGNYHHSGFRANGDDQFASSYTFQSLEPPTGVVGKRSVLQFLMACVVQPINISRYPGRLFDHNPRRRRLAQHTYIKFAPLFISQALATTLYACDQVSLPSTKPVHGAVYLFRRA